MTREIKVWTKVGELQKLAGKFGKWLGSQNFLNPDTNNEEEFVFFGQKNWSVVLAITDDNQVLVERQYKQGCHKIMDELPAGTADFKDETPEQVMRRELEEETGYVPGNVIALGSYWIASRSSPTCFHCFLATGCRKVHDGKVDLSEVIETRLVSLAEWIAMIHSGEIEEPSAVVATMRSLPYLSPNSE